MKFRTGDFSLDNVPRLGKPVEVDSDQIKTLIETNRPYTMWKIADILKNIQINKVIGDNEKCVFYFTEKKTYGLFGQPNVILLLLGAVVVVVVGTDAFPFF